eukprot:g7353.t1
MLAVLIEDGNVLLCDLDQLQPMPLTGSKNALFVACDPRYLSPCKFAIAVKSGMRKYQIDVYEISRGWDSELKLIAQHPLQEEIKDLAWLDNNIIVASKSTYYSIHGNSIHPILQPKSSTLFTTLPIPDLAVFLWEDCLAVIVDATGSAARPPLMLDSKPLLLTQGGMCIVSELVLDLLNDDERLVMLHHADTPSGSTILMASSRSVWMLRPVAHEAQTIQLLKSGSIEAALELAESCLTESWAEDVFAQAGLLLLQQGKWKFALDCFQRCSSTVFQPSQLFPLFPKWTRRWANQVCLKSYWGLHRELGDLKSLVDYRQRLESIKMDDEPSIRGKDPQEEKIAQNHVANYLMTVRCQSNIHCMDGVDALIIYLLSSTGSVSRLETFVQTEHQAEIDDVRAHLVSHQHFLALTLMAWKKTRYEEALEVLRKLCLNEYHESISMSGSVYNAKGNQTEVATYYAAVILSESDMEEMLQERNLKWLVDVSPLRFLQVCQVCALKESIILNLIPPKNIQLQFRFLHHIVHTTDTPTRITHYHTKLGLLLCQLLEGRTDFETNEEKLPFMFADDDAYYRNPDCQVSASQTNVLNFEHIFKQRLLVPISKQPPNGSDEIQRLNVFNGQELREILQHHLINSREYDGVEILKQLEHTCLYEEQVILNCRLKDHVKALRILAITLKDIHSAIRYCKVYAGNEGFISLLDMLLKPGKDQEPLYTDAIQVLNAESGNLDPMRVLDTLSETMPLSLAYPTLARMLRERTHRKRQTRITHELCKAQNVQYKAEKHDLESGFQGRVYIDVDTECVLCRKSLAGKIFYNAKGVFLTSPFSVVSVTLFRQIDHHCFTKLKPNGWGVFSGFFAPLSHFDYLREDQDDMYKKTDPKDIVNPRQIMVSSTLSDKLALEEEIKNRKNQESYVQGSKPERMRRSRFGNWLNFSPRKNKKDDKSSESLYINDGRVNMVYGANADDEEIDMSDELESGKIARSLPKLNELGKGSSNRFRLLGQELGVERPWTGGNDNTATPLNMEEAQERIPGLNLGRQYDTGLKFDRTRPALRVDRYSTAWVRPEIEPKKLRNGNLDTRPVLEFDLARTEAVKYLGGDRYKSSTPVSATDHDFDSAYTSESSQREHEMRTGAELIYNQTPLGEYSRQDKSSPSFRYMTTWEEVYDAFKLLSDENIAQDISQAFFTLKHMKPSPPEAVLVEMANGAIEHAHQMMPISLTNIIHSCAKLKFFYPPLLQNWEIQLKDNKVLEACTDLDITCLVYSFGVLNRIGRYNSLRTGSPDIGVDFGFVEKLAHEALHPIRLEHYTHTMLVNILYGLSLLKYRKTEVLDKILSTICKDDVLPRLEAQNLSSVLYSIGYLKFWAPDLTDRVVEEVLSRISEFDVAGLSNILWSLGNAKYTNQELVGKIAKICSEEHHLRNCTEQDLMNIVYGVAMCRYKNPTVLSQYVIELMKPGRLPQVHDMALANLLSSFASLKYTNDQLLTAILAELSSPKRLKKLKNMVIANAFYALGSMRFRQPYCLHKLIDEIVEPDRLPTFSEYDLCIIAHASGSIRIKDRSFVQTLMKELSKEERLSRYTPQNLATIVNACELLYYKDQELLSNVCRLLTQEKALARLPSNGVSLVTLGLCRLQFYDPSFFGEYLKLCTSPERISTIRPNTLIDLMFGSMRAEVANFSQFMAVIKEIREPRILMTLMNFSLVRLITVASLIGLRDETFLNNIKQEVLNKERLKSLTRTDVRDVARALERMSYYDEELCTALGFGPRERGQSVGILAPGGLQKLEDEDKQRDEEKQREEQNLDWSGRIRPTFYD